MDSPSNPFNGNSQRRRLVKKPPSHQHSQSSFGADGGPDSDHLQSQHSSEGLRRAPSAPPMRSNPSNGSSTSNVSSSRQHSNSTANTSNWSPTLLQGGFSASPTQGRSTNAPYPYQIKRTSDPHHRKPSDDLLGKPFDGEAILNHFNTSKGLTNTQLPAPPRPTPPPAQTKSKPDGRLASRPLRASASFSNMDPSVSERSSSGRSGDGGFITPKRYSDDGKDLKSSMLRRKAGFSTLMSNLVGNTKKPVISAPENPVHVTHVGYDSNTGNFTVSA